jgi:hypothetical protein
MKLNRITDPCWSKATLNKVVELIAKAHGLDLYPFDETFLAKSLSKRGLIAPPMTCLTSAQPLRQQASSALLTWCFAAIYSSITDPISANSLWGKCAVACHRRDIA